MSPNRYQVEADSIEALNASVLAEYGPDAAVVAVKVVTVGGVQGFFAQRRFRATVETADGTAEDAHAFDLPARAGIGALLDSADSADLAGYGAALGAPDWTVSTSSVDFAAVLADLTFTTSAHLPAAAASRAPTPAGPLPLGGAGDLVLVVGLGDDPLAVALAIAGAGASVVRIAGRIERDDIARVDDRRAVVAARAEGVRSGHAVVVAFGLPLAGPTPEAEARLAAIHPDQAWVAVDAGRKADDTLRWVEGVSAVVPLDAVMSWERGATATPETVEQLGLPLGWLESGW